MSPSSTHKWFSFKSRFREGLPSWFFFFGGGLRWLFYHPATGRIKLDVFPAIAVHDAPLSTCLSFGRCNRWHIFGLPCLHLHGINRHKHWILVSARISCLVAFWKRNRDFVVPRFVGCSGKHAVGPINYVHGFIVICFCYILPFLLIILIEDYFNSATVVIKRFDDDRFLTNLKDVDRIDLYQAQLNTTNYRWFGHFFWCIYLLRHGSHYTYVPQPLLLSSKYHEWAI